eukprot:1255254-Amphidinium_carterae.1
MMVTIELSISVGHARLTCQQRGTKTLAIGKGLVTLVCQGHKEASLFRSYARVVFYCTLRSSWNGLTLKLWGLWGKDQGGLYQHWCLWGHLQHTKNANDADQTEEGHGSKALHCL